MDNTESEYIQDIELKKGLIESFGKRYHKFGYEKDVISNLTMEDKLLLQLENKKN
jgi:hypothetical protein